MEGVLGVSFMLENLSGVEAKGFNLDLETFLHHVCDKICGRLDNFYSIYPYKVNRIHMQKYFLTCKTLFRKSLTSGNVSEELFSSYEQYQLFSKVLAERKAEIFKALKDEAILTGQPALIDFDWAVRIVLGSDKICSIPKSVLQLQFRIKQPDDLKGVNVSTLELKREELDQVLASLEGALKAYEKIS